MTDVTPMRIGPDLVTTDESMAVLSPFDGHEVGRVPVGKLLMRREGVAPVSEAALQERRWLAETGLVVAVVVLQEKESVAKATKRLAAKADSIAAAKAPATAAPHEEIAKAGALPEAAAAERASADSAKGTAAPAKAARKSAPAPAKAAGSAVNPPASKKTAPATPAPQEATPAPSIGGSPNVVAGGRLSKIFKAMSSKDAAKVLEQMDESDVLTILSALPEKKAGEVMTMMPPARAAALSKVLIKGKVGST